MYMAIIEASLGITAASLPMLRPIFRKLRDSPTLSSRSRRRADSTSQPLKSDIMYGSSSNEQLKPGYQDRTSHPMYQWPQEYRDISGRRSTNLSGVDTFISSNALEKNQGDELPMHKIKVRNDVHFHG